MAGRNGAVDRALPVLQYSEGGSLAVSGWKPLTGVMEGGIDPLFYWTTGSMKIKFGKVLWPERMELIFEIIKRDQGRITERSGTVKATGLKDDPCSNMLMEATSKAAFIIPRKSMQISRHEVVNYRVSFSHAVREDQPCLREARHLQPFFLSENSVLFPGVKTERCGEVMCQLDGWQLWVAAVCRSDDGRETQSLASCFVV